MVDQNLIKQLDISDAEIDAQFEEFFGDESTREGMDKFVSESMTDFDANTILKARVVGIVGNDVVLDVGLKSEGVVDKGEWEDAADITPGAEVEVLLEEVESDTGVVMLSKRKADRIVNWRRIVETCAEGDRVSGKVLRKIKGGLLVDIGVNVFLPASAVASQSKAYRSLSNCRRTSSSTSASKIRLNTSRPTRCARYRPT